MICEKCATDGRCHEGCVCCARLARAEAAEEDDDSNAASGHHAVQVPKPAIATYRVDGAGSMSAGDVVF